MLIFKQNIFFFAEEAQLNGGDSESHVNGGDSQKYSQILGDHHTNYATQLSNKSTSSQPHQIFKARSFNNNKENYYNQRSALRSATGLKNGWHRSNSANFRSSTFNFKEGHKKGEQPHENGKSGSNNGDEDCKEPIKFNEGKFFV